MEFFVDVANECRKLNNYNSFMAIAGENPLATHTVIAFHPSVAHNGYHAHSIAALVETKVIL